MQINTVTREDLKKSPILIVCMLNQMLVNAFTAFQSITEKCFFFLFSVKNLSF